MVEKELLLKQLEELPVEDVRRVLEYMKKVKTDWHVSSPQRKQSLCRSAPESYRT